MKTLVQDNNASGQNLFYVKSVEICHTRLAILNISRSVLPGIFISPLSTSESWYASQTKIATHQIRADLVMEYNQRELSIIGDSTRPQGQGIVDFVTDFISVFRDHRLSVSGNNYLDKPLEISSVNYREEAISNESFLIVATVSMRAIRTFVETTLPGNV